MFKFSATRCLLEQIEASSNWVASVGWKKLFGRGSITWLWLKYGIGEPTKRIMFVSSAVASKHMSLHLRMVCMGILIVGFISDRFVWVILNHFQLLCCSQKSARSAYPTGLIYSRMAGACMVSSRQCIITTYDMSHHILYHIVSCHFISFHITSCHAISKHIITFLQ
jgi:hypothetical protein